MLDSLHAYTGSPPGALHFLPLPHETLLLYPSVDAVVVLNARSLAFVRALAFWEAFPSTRHLGQSIRALSIHPGMKLVVAALGNRIAVWNLSGSQNEYWRVHSSLLLPEDQEITAVHCVSGLLALGTKSALSVYTLTLENDLPTWSLKWTASVASISNIRFSPSLMYIATTSAHDSTVRVYLTTTGRQTQSIPHPRPVRDIVWRNSEASNRDDCILYTTTSDGTLRIFLPVLDAPQYLQLHAALDQFSCSPSSFISQPATSHIFWLDREVVGPTLTSIHADGHTAEEDARRRRIREIKEEGWDLFLRVMSDGSLVVQAVANIDRRPPTLLKQFTLLQTAPNFLTPTLDHLYVVPHPTRGALTLVTCPPLASYDLSLLPFFDAHAGGLECVAKVVPGSIDDTRAEIVRFSRTTTGDGVASLRTDGSGDSWNVNTTHKGLLSHTGKWAADDTLSVDHFVVLDAGHHFVTYSSTKGLLTLHSTTPPQTLAVSPLSSVFPLPRATKGSTDRILVGVSEGDARTILLIGVSLSPTAPSLSLQAQTSLPLPAPPKFIIPVDPMAWSGQFGEGTRGVQERDVLLSVSEDGELAFWNSEGGLGLGNLPSRPTINGRGRSGGIVWKCTGIVRTGRKGMSMARCSSAKKSVLVVPSQDGEELTIWDSKESEFALGLEHRQMLPLVDRINDLDWTATPDNQSILAVGFAHRIELLCQQRMTYFDETPAWDLCWKLDLGSMIPHPISDSVWLGRGSLLVGAGNFMFLFGQPQLGMSPEEESTAEAESLFEHVARLNGPLDDYHPQMVLQALLWGKVEFIKDVVVNLAQHVEDRKSFREWKNLPIERFLQRRTETKEVHAVMRPKYSQLFSMPDIKEEADDDPFSRQVVEQLISKLEESPIPHLTPREQASLLVLIQTTLEIEEQRRALDENGLRYLISMRSFYILNQRASEPSSPASGGVRTQPALSKLTRRERLRYRDIVWAFHSESEELLLSSSVAACGGKMGWQDARALGVFMWLRTGDRMKAHMEIVARNEYMSGDNRDPTACSLFYFALGKVKLVHGLWRQAAWHKEQAVMLKFLNNDFREPRWRTAALKNAFALLSKRRFEYAAAFFLLGDHLKDAVNVCLKNLSDFQLAVALARIVEGGDDGPVLSEILNGTVIPLAFKDGNRWLASWAFWLLHRRDLAVRILVTPLQDMAAVLDVTIMEIGDPHYDDPSLALLFSQLKSKTIQTAQGTSEISGRTEFNFVLQIARVFCRMGCHALALDLVRSWSFQRPSTAVHDDRTLVRSPPSPISTRFALEPALRRQSSILIDIDVTSAPPTRRASPTRSRSPAPPASPAISTSGMREELKPESDLVARKAGMGSLMKSAKQDVKVPEFDMNAFF